MEVEFLQNEGAKLQPTGYTTVASEMLSWAGDTLAREKVWATEMCQNPTLAKSEGSDLLAIFCSTGRLFECH